MPGVLTEKQKQAVKLLCVDGLKVQETASRLGVHRCTIWRWSRLKEFNKEWKRLLKEEAKKYRAEFQKKNNRRMWQRKVNRLERAAKEAAANIKGNNTAAFEKAYNDYRSALLEGIIYKF